MKRFMPSLHFPFECPGKATLWGMIGCIVCCVFPDIGFKWQAVITIITALIGCYK